MIIEFKTPRSTCGHRDYLKLDTEKKTYSREPHFIAEGLEITRKELKEVLENAIEDGYKVAK